MSIVVAKTVRYPISLKIFGIALLLVMLMICVTILSSMNLRRVGQQLDFLSHFYIKLEQQMGEVRAHGLTQQILLERILQNKPQVAMSVAREDAAKLKSGQRRRFDKIRQPPDGMVRGPWIRNEGAAKTRANNTEALNLRLHNRG